MSLTLSLTPISSSTITESSLNDLVRLSLDLINTLPSRSSPPPASTSIKIAWSAAKGDAETKLWKATHNNEPWVARVTDCGDIGYQEIRQRLLVEKTATEKEALLLPNDVIEFVGEERVWGELRVQDLHKLLHVQAFSPREFLETVVYVDLPEKNGKKSCIMIQFPRAGEIKNSSHAHGVYSTVETIRELDGGKVEVILACSSNAGGNIPRWIQNIAISGQILADSQKYFKYMRENRNV